MLQKCFLSKNKKKNKNYILNKEYIMYFLFKKNKSISKSSLIKCLNIYDKKKLKKLNNILNLMYKNNQIIFLNKRISLSNNLNLIVGTIISHPNGFGFLRVNDKKEDYYLSSKEMKNVIHGDKVLAKIKNINYKRKKANILSIIIPQKNPIIGTFILKKKYSFILPKDNKFNFKIFLSTKNNKINIKNKSIVSVKITNRKSNIKNIFGKIIKNFGCKNNINTFINTSLYINNFSEKWPKNIENKVNKYTKNIKSKEIKERKDIRHLPLCTIDNYSSHDLDDAVYCEKSINKSWKLLVAISDVSYYVKENSLLDKEAFNRSTSLYLYSKVIPMLPEFISNNLCSLIPNVDRLSVVCEILISNTGDIISYKFYEAVIRSFAKLNYEQVSDILLFKNNFNYKKNLINSIKNLYSLYKILKKSRENRGGIFLNNLDYYFVFNSDYNIKSIKKLKCTIAHKIIEECMILANIAASYFVSINKNHAIYRVHEEPSKENIIMLRNILNRFNIKLEGKDHPSPKDFFKVIQLVSKKQNKDILSIIILRSMKQAVYDAYNKGHFGLSLKSYTHFTSPIRRYSDLVIHRIIKYNFLLKNNKKNIKLNGGKNYSLIDILNISKQCSIKERKADLIYRDIDDWLKCKFMKKHIGKIFNGFISKITNFGFFVKLDNFIEGLVHSSSFTKMNYFLDIKNQIIINNKNKIIYSIGDILKIKIKKIYTNNSIIRFSLEK